jgi:hypothetical protein
MRILDLTAGNRACWVDRNDPRAIFIDKRAEVLPSVVADACALPAEIVGPFDIVVFDPPHKNNGPRSGMTRSYGHSTADEITALLKGAAKEAHRVAGERALMAFKWNDHTRKLASVLPLLAPYWTPILAHGLSHQQARSNTYWALLSRNNLSGKSSADQVKP